MIMFWNRKEVFVGFSMKEFNAVRDVLESIKVKYIYRTVNYGGGTIGQDSRFSIMYYIYIHKKDADIVSKALYDQLHTK